MSLTRKPTTLKEARTIAASGAARIAYNAVDCVKRLQDAVLGLKDADILLTDLANAKRPVEKQRLETRLLAKQLVLLRTTMESQHVLLRQSIVGLASEATVRACEMTRNHKHTEYLKAGYYKGFETKQHQKRLWQFMKNSTCPWGKGKHTSTATTPAGPEEEMAAPLLETADFRCVNEDEEGAAAAAAACVSTRVSSTSTKRHEYTTSSTLRSSSFTRGTRTNSNASSWCPNGKGACSRCWARVRRRFAFCHAAQ
jgi:hypothetical protein